MSDVKPGWASGFRNIVFIGVLRWRMRRYEIARRRLDRQQARLVRANRRIEGALYGCDRCPDCGGRALHERSCDRARCAHGQRLACEVC